MLFVSVYDGCMEMVFNSGWEEEKFILMAGFGRCYIFESSLGIFVFLCEWISLFSGRMCFFFSIVLIMDEFLGGMVRVFRSRIESFM